MSGSVALSIEMDPRTPAAFSQLSVQFPREMYRAHGQAASTVARKIRAAVRKLGNKDTGRLPGLSDLRNLIHPGTPGGILGENANKLVAVQRRGGVLYAGYVSGIEGVFSRWQEGGDTPIPENARAWLHRRAAAAGARDMEVPETATQPARPVIAPIAEVTRTEFPAWVERAATKLIEKSLARARR